MANAYFIFQMHLKVNHEMLVASLVSSIDTTTTGFSSAGSRSDTADTKDESDKGSSDFMPLPVLSTKLSFQRGNISYPRIAYVTFCHLITTGRFEEFIFPALEWWVPADEPYFVVLSRSWQSRYNQLLETNDNFTKFNSRIHPIFVNCKEGKASECVCCKQQEGMLYMMEHYDYDWILYLDDDNFVRSSYMRAFLTNISTSELLAITSGPAPRLLGQFGYLPLEKTPYLCTKDMNYSYSWGQMVAYNRRTLQHIRRGLELGGLVKQCVEYGVFHDVGNAIFHWMYQLPDLRLFLGNRPSWPQPWFLGVHGVGRCQEAGFDCPMHEIAERLNRSQYAPPLDNLPMQWRTGGKAGFRTTSTFQAYGDPSQWDEVWHTMPIQDCLGPNATSSTSNATVRY